MQSRSRTFLLGAASAAVVLILVELALRIAAPFPNPYGEPGLHRINRYIRFEYPRHYAAVTEAEAGLSGVSGRNHFTTNNMGFRGGELVRPRPADEYRIFLVGGSTVECFYLDDADELGRGVEAALPPRPDGRVARVYNVGLSGAASDDHVAMISQRLVHLEPDLIVVMAGVNDLTRSIFGFDYLHYVDPDAGARPWYKRAAMSFQIVRRLHRLKTRMTPDTRTLQESRPLVSNYTALVELQRSGAAAPDSTARTDEASYARNLRTIAGIAQAHGFGLVLATQPTTWASRVDAKARLWSWMRYRDGVTYSEEAMDAAMNRLNATARAVAAQAGLPVSDLAAEIPKSLDYFYDDCHFNRAGAAEAGKRLAATLSAGWHTSTTPDSTVH